MSSRKRPAVGTGKPSGKRIRGTAVRIKEDPGSFSNNASSAAPTSSSAAAAEKSSEEVVRQRFIALFSEPQFKHGISNKNLKEKFPSQQEFNTLALVINSLLGQSRLLMSKGSSETDLYYSLVAEDVAQKYIGLALEAKMVLQVIEKAHDNGIWTKDIRMQTNIQQQALNKIFKQLEQRQLIKPVKSVNSKAKKLYMLYELTPSKELTGGVWYSGLEFDHEFINELRTFVMHCVRRLNSGQGVTLEEIKNKMAEAKVSRVELRREEVKQLIQTLVYDYLVEEGTTTPQGEIRFVAARRVTTMCDFKWWDSADPDFHFRSIKFEDGVTIGPHEPHHHTA